jgi:pre-mRNA-splicing factor SPF27
MAEHTFNALPYYDDDLQKYPFLKEKVEQEIRREMGKVPDELHPRVPPVVEIFAVREQDLFRVLDMGY